MNEEDSSSRSAVREHPVKLTARAIRVSFYPATLLIAEKDGRWGRNVDGRRDANLSIDPRHGDFA